MKALVYIGPGQKSWTEAPDPQIIDPRTRSSGSTRSPSAAPICTSWEATCRRPVRRVLGHEAVGTVHAVGSAVSGLQVGDRVLASCISACGTCSYCRQASYGQCRNGGGWILGHLVDGVQAQYARIPFADLSTHKLPAAITDEVAVLLADILPTSFEVGVTNGHVQPGDTVVVVGTGPIGLAAILTARLYSPSHIIAIDKAESRLQAAKQLGADITIKPDDNPLEAVRGVTDGSARTWYSRRSAHPRPSSCARRSFAPGAGWRTSACTGTPSRLHLEDLWIRNITITTGLVDTYSTPRC